MPGMAARAAASSSSRVNPFSFTRGVSPLAVTSTRASVAPGATYLHGVLVRAVREIGALVGRIERLAHELQQFHFLRLKLLLEFRERRAGRHVERREVDAVAADRAHLLRRSARPDRTS